MTGEWCAPQFAGLPFGLGSLIGTRSFKVSGDGWLYGYIHEHQFNADVNIARCLRADLACGYRPDAGGTHIHSRLCRAVVPCDKDVPNADCTCGFYAYTDGSLDYGVHVRMISGVIQGFGHVLRGSRGFRCKKARVLALYVPPRMPESLDAASQMWTPVGPGEHRIVNFRPTWLPDITVDLLRDHYPAVEFYDDVDRMIADFPSGVREV